MNRYQVPGAHGLVTTLKAWLPIPKVAGDGTHLELMSACPNLEENRAAVARSTSADFLIPHKLHHALVPHANRLRKHGSQGRDVPVPELDALIVTCSLLEDVTLPVLRFIRGKHACCPLQSSLYATRRATPFQYPLGLILEGDFHS